MPIIPSKMGNVPTIKTWSFEHVVTSDGRELCEPCARESGFDVDGENPDENGIYDCTPIFADTEMDRESICDACSHVSRLHTIITTGE